jgi:exopolysaccharide biosynthesis polyprenyl glycosylphosphotransferase
MGRRFLRSVFAYDIVALGIAMSIASWVVYDTLLLWRAEIPGDGSLWPMVALMFGSALLLAYIMMMTWAKSAPRPNYGRALAMVTITVGITALGLVITRSYWSRAFLLVTAAAWLAMTLLQRFIRRQRPWAEAMVVVTGEKELADQLQDAPHARVLGVLHPWERPPEAPLPDGTTLVVDLRAVMSEEMAQFVSSSSIAGYRIRTLTDVYEEHTGRIPLVHLAEGWELTQPVERSGYAVVKRGLDMAGVLVLAPLWLPLAAVIWVLVKLGADGPGLYHQERVGRDDQTFVLHKFRTMVNDAEVDGPQFAREGDPRLTRVGSFLRNSRLDELPQVWNVLRGDLSLVGPRPERPIFVRQYEQTIPYYGNRHVIRPGITGWAQVNYGYADDEADAVEKLTYDLYYVKHSSLWFDVHVLGRSVWTVLTGFGAR